MITPCQLGKYVHMTLRRLDRSRLASHMHLFFDCEASVALMLDMQHPPKTTTTIHAFGIGHRVPFLGLTSCVTVTPHTSHKYPSELHRILAILRQQQWEPVRPKMVTVFLALLLLTTLPGSCHGLDRPRSNRLGALTEVHDEAQTLKQEVNAGSGDVSWVEVNEE